MNGCPDICLGDVNGEVSLRRLLIRVIHSRKALDLAVARFSVDTTPVGLFRVFERGGNVDQVEATVFLDELASVLAGLFERRDRGSNDGGASLGELGGNKGNTANVTVAVFARISKLAGEL